MGQLTEIRLGTRRSPLARLQAECVKKALLAQDSRLKIDIVEIITQGDQISDQSLAELGGKGLFVRALHDALRKRKIHAAVHSVKDMEAGEQETDLHFGAVLEREDTHDALIVRKDLGRHTLASLPSGSRIGTASPRRKSLFLYHRPDCQTQLLRGNVHTRLEKLHAGACDAVILARAGLKRLGIDAPPIEIPDWLPAPGQGAIGLVWHRDCKLSAEIFPLLNHAVSWRQVCAERALLAQLSGSCFTPIAARAQNLPEEQIFLRAMILDPSGKRMVSASKTGKNPCTLGIETGKILQSQIPDAMRAALGLQAHTLQTQGQTWRHLRHKEKL